MNNRGPNIDPCGTPILLDKIYVFVKYYDITYEILGEDQGILYSFSYLVICLVQI